MDSSCGLRVLVGMNFNEGVNRADKLILFTFSHHSSHKSDIGFTGCAWFNQNDLGT